MNVGKMCVCVCKKIWQLSKSCQIYTQQTIKQNIIIYKSSPTQFGQEPDIISKRKTSYIFLPRQRPLLRYNAEIISRLDQ